MFKILIIIGFSLLSKENASDKFDSDDELPPFEEVTTFDSIKEDEKSRGRFFTNVNTTSFDVTMTTHLTFNRFVCLPSILRLWRGYVSCSYFIQTCHCDNLPS